MKAIGRTIFVMINLAIGTIAMGQYALEDMDHFILKYPGESQVLINGKRTYTITKGKEGLDIRLKVLRDRLITKSGAITSFSEEVYSDSTATEIMEIEAYSLVPENGKYRKYKVDQFYEKDDLSGVSFNSDGKNLQFYFPKTGKKVVTHLEYETQLKVDYFLPSVFTAMFFPYEHFEVELIVDNDIDMQIDPYHINEGDMVYTVDKGKRTTTHHWVFDEVAAVDYQNDAPDPRWYLPHLIMRIKGYETDEGYTPVLTDLDDLYRLYRTWMDMIDTEDADALRPLVTQIVAGAENDDEKMRRIFNWVQANIKYIAFSDGMRGTVPESAKEVIGCRFGDCKGMSNLMHNMAALEGIDTYHTWIGTRDIPYSYEEVSSPLVDNHMILSYQMGDSLIFLDATDSYLPFGMPSAFIQGKQALVSNGPDDYSLSDVPVMTGDNNAVSDSIYVTVSGNDLVGRGVRRMRGYSSTDIQHGLNRVDADDERDYIQRIVSIGDDRFALEEFTTEISADKEEVVIDYSFRIPQYVTSYEDELFLNLNFDKSFGASRIDEGRVVPVDMGYAWETHQVVILDLDDETSISFVPDNQEYLDEHFGYQIKYRQETARMVIDSQSYSNDLILRKEDFNHWNELSEKFKKSVSQNILLKK